MATLGHVLSGNPGCLGRSHSGPLGQFCYHLCNIGLSISQWFLYKPLSLFKCCIWLLSIPFAHYVHCVLAYAHLCGIWRVILILCVRVGIDPACLYLTLMLYRTCFNVSFCVNSGDHPFPMSCLVFPPGPGRVDCVLGNRLLNSLVVSHTWTTT
jgi:hypothetical protein